MSVEWYYIITEDGQIIDQRLTTPPALGDQFAAIGGAALAQMGEALAAFSEACHNIWEDIKDLLRPAVEAMTAFAASLRRLISPQTRAWLHRRHAYAGRPVVGPSRPALFALRHRRCA